MCLDECASNPCLFGAECTNRQTPNTYTCSCLVNDLNQQVYEGVNCQERVNTDLCSGQCSDCVVDYRINGPRCMCQPGETSSTFRVNCDFEGFVNLAYFFYLFIYFFFFLINGTV